MNAISEHQSEPGRRPIRVLHCAHAWLNLSENWCFRLISQTPETEVHVISRRYLPGAPWRAGFRAHHWPVGPIENPRRLVSRRLFNGLVRAVDPLQRRILAQELKGQIDLIHAHFSTMAWDYLPLAKTLKVPLVISFYGLDYESLAYSNPRWRDRYRTLFDAAALILCEGPHGVANLVKQGCPAGKLAVIRLGVDVTGVNFPAIHRRSVPLRVVQVARLMEKKGHLIALRAVAAAARTIPIHYTIVGGDGNVKRRDLIQQAQELGISSSVKFIDGIDSDHLSKFLGNFDAFLHPSRYGSDRDCEGGAPVVLLDSQAVGLPVVATTHCDIPDEVKNEVTGYLAAEDDYEGVAAGLVKLAQLSDSEYESLRQAGRRHVEQYYSIADNTAELARHYRQLLS